MAVIAWQVSSRKASPPMRMSLSLFPSEIGWFAVLGDSRGLSRLTFGHTSPVDARRVLGISADEADEADWTPKLRQKLENYALGKQVNFDDVEVVRSRPLTVFQQRVVEIVRAIPRGETLTYGEVATLAGSPGAARAVGTVMSSNPVPVIVPCHRVVGSAGGLGGFSAAGGVRTKQWMLDLESRK